MPPNPELQDNIDGQSKARGSCPVTWPMPDSGVVNPTLGGIRPFFRLSTDKTASITPAAPRQWPIAPFTE